MAFSYTMTKNLTIVFMCNCGFIESNRTFFLLRQIKIQIVCVFGQEQQLAKVNGGILCCIWMPENVLLVLSSYV